MVNTMLGSMGLYLTRHVHGKSFRWICWWIKVQSMGLLSSMVIAKDTDAGKDWGQEKAATENKMVGRHHWLNGHDLQQTLGDSGGQRSLACVLQSLGSQRVRPDLVTEQHMDTYSMSSTFPNFSHLIFIKTQWDRRGHYYELHFLEEEIEA